MSKFGVLDFRIARSVEAQIRTAEVGNRAQHKLNILAAVTFPLMAVTAVFGMNLHSGLEGLPVIAFWLVFIGGLLLGMFAKGWVGSTTPPVVSQQLERGKK